MQTKCKACKGTYHLTLKDGSEYYHSCAPIGEKPNGQPIEQPNKRDERIKLDAKGERCGIVAAGYGVEDALEE